MLGCGVVCCLLFGRGVVRLGGVGCWGQFKFQGEGDKRLIDGGGDI